jgi:RHS repeat-associated protein
VTQGVQARTFVYTSLSRLKSAINPEKGTTSYTYYATSDIATKTDGPAVTTFTYDGLHRISGKSYTGVSTPQVTYSYYPAGQTPKVGRLQSVTTSAAGTSYDYDSLGRVTSSTQSIAGAVAASFRFSNYSYKLNDALTSITYPSGRVVNYTYDDAGRVLTSQDPSKTKPYVDLAVVTDPTQRYTPAGQLSQMKLGNDLWEKRDFNPLGQAASLKLGTSQGANDRVELGYTYSANANSGNVQTHTISISQPMWSRTQTFGYDLLNRLTSVQEGTGGWSQSYGYDQFGNHWVTNASSSGLTYADPNEPTSQSAIDATTNKLAGLGYTDGRGNLNQYNPHTLSYDAENRLIRTTSASSGALDFSYDGEGRRVKKVSTGGTAVTTYYVYDAFGNLAAEYGGAGSDTETKYLFTDHLGSTRVKSGATGQVMTRHDYLPFGRQLSAVDSGRTTAMGYVDQADPMQEPFPIKFTGLERDAETGLDNFIARYYSGAQGRFTGPDPLLASSRPEDPQTWNRYAYGFNNPLRFIDPTGMEAISEEDCRKNPECINVRLNVVLDKKADIYDKNGSLLPKYQKQLDKQIAQAQDEYGSMGVHLDVSYTKGTINAARRTIGEGLSATAINMGVTNSEGVASSLFIAGSEIRNGVATGVMNLDRADQGTLAHELAHHFAGDTSTGMVGAVLNLLSFTSMNAMADYSNDFQRWRLRGAPAYSHDYFLSIQNDWRNWARRFSSPQRIW